jgi:tetratricopeptide (TPR) repeat protein
LSELLFGATGSASKSLWAQFADLLADLGRTDEALAAAERALQARGDGQEDADSALATAMRAFALARQGKLADARDALHRAVDLGEQLKLSTIVDFQDANRFIAETAVMVGEPPLAVQAYENNLVADKDVESASPAWVGTYRIGGKAYLAAGQPAKARDVLEKGLSLASGHAFYPRWVPDIRFRLAQALVATQGDRKRAYELTHAAREELLKLPEEKALLDELTAWEATALDIPSR